MIKHNPPSPEPLHRAIARFGERHRAGGRRLHPRPFRQRRHRADFAGSADSRCCMGAAKCSTMGGAGNVVANIVSLGACRHSGLGDRQRSGRRQSVRMLGELGVDTAGLAQDRDRMTSSKSRFSALNQQVLRFDEEEIKPLGDAERATLIRHFRDALTRADIVILSDYGKGILLDGVAGELIVDLPRGGKAGAGRSEGPRLCALCRGDRHHAQSQGTRRGRRPRGVRRRRDRGGGARADLGTWLRLRRRDAQRKRHERRRPGTMPATSPPRRAKCSTFRAPATR